MKAVDYRELIEQNRVMRAAWAEDMDSYTFIRQEQESGAAHQAFSERQSKTQARPLTLELNS